MWDQVMEWFKALPPTSRVLAAIVLTAVLLGAGIYDTRTRSQANSTQIVQVQDSLQKLTTRMSTLDQDVGNVLCILRAEAQGREVPLSCLQERREGANR